MQFDELITIFNFLTLFNVVLPGVATVIFVYINGAKYTLDDINAIEVPGGPVVDGDEEIPLPTSKAQNLLRAFRRKVDKITLTHGGLKSFTQLLIQLLLDQGVNVYVPGMNKFSAFKINYRESCGEFRRRYPAMVYCDKAPSEKYEERLRKRKYLVEADIVALDRKKEKDQLLKCRRVYGGSYKGIARSEDDMKRYINSINEKFNEMLLGYERGCKFVTIYGFKYDHNLTTRYSDKDIAIIPNMYLSEPMVKGSTMPLLFNGTMIGTVSCMDVNDKNRQYRVQMMDQDDCRYDYIDVVSQRMIDTISRQVRVNLGECEETITGRDCNFTVALPEDWRDLDAAYDVDFDYVVGGLEYEQFVNEKNKFPTTFKMRDDVTGKYYKMYGPSDTHCWLYILNECMYHEYLKGNLTDRQVEAMRRWIYRFVESYGNVGENHLQGQQVPVANRPVPHMNTVNFGVNQQGINVRLNELRGLDERDPSHWPAAFDAWENPLPGSLSLHKVKLLYNSFSTTFNIPIDLTVVKINYKMINNERIPVPPAATQIHYGPRDRVGYKCAIMAVAQVNGAAADQINHDMHAYFGMDVKLGNSRYYFLTDEQYEQYLNTSVGNTFQAVVPKLHNSRIVSVRKVFDNIGGKPLNVLKINDKVSMKYTGRGDCGYILCKDAIFRAGLEKESLADEEYIDALMGISKESVIIQPVTMVEDYKYGGTSIACNEGTLDDLKNYSVRYILKKCVRVVFCMMLCFLVMVWFSSHVETCYVGVRKAGHKFSGYDYDNGCGIYAAKPVECKFAKIPSTLTGYFQKRELWRKSVEQMRDVGLGNITRVEYPEEFDSQVSMVHESNVVCFNEHVSSFYSSYHYDECFEDGVVDDDLVVHSASEYYPFCQYPSDCNPLTRCYKSSKWTLFGDLFPYLLCSVILVVVYYKLKWLWTGVIINLDYGACSNKAYWSLPMVPLVLRESLLNKIGIIYCTKGAAQAALRTMKETGSAVITDDMMLYLKITGKGDWLDIKGDVAGLYASVPGIYQCPSIPFNYPDIPAIHGSAVKLTDIDPLHLPQYATRNMEYQMLCCPPSMMLDESLYIHYNKTTAESIDHALFCRLMLGRHGQHVNFQAVYDAYTKWYDRNLHYFEDARELGLDELIRLHPRGSRYKGVTVGYEEALNTVFSGFIKTEPYDIDKKVKPTRAIISPGKKATVWGLKFTHLIEKGLHKSPNFSKAKNSRDTAIDLENMWNKFNNTVAIGCDFTQFENGVNVPVLIGSMSMFHTLCGMPQEYVKNWLNRTIYFCRRWKVVLKGKRISGEYQTSLGNMIIVGTMLQRVCDLAAKKGKTFDYYSAGDDCMIFCEKEDKDLAVRLINRVVEEFGMLIKIEDFYEDFEKIHFCQQYPVLTDKGYWMINDIKRVFNKLFVQPKVIADSKHQRNRLACLGDYLNYMYPNVPFVNTVVTNLHGYWDKEHRYSKAFNTSHDWHILEVKGNNNFEPNYNIKDVDHMLDVMGFPKWIGEYYDEYWKDVNVFDLTEPRTVEFAYDVEKKDMFIQLSFFERHFLKPKFENTSTVENLRYSIEDRALNEVDCSCFGKLITVSLPSSE